MSMFIILALVCLSVEIYTHPVELQAYKDQQQQTTKPTIQTSTSAIPFSVVKKGQGPVYDWLNDQITVRLSGSQTQGLFTLTEDAMKPTFKIGLHKHTTHVETFHILEGEVEFRLGTQIHVAQPGTTVHVPKNIPHAVRITNGRPARLLMSSSPSGFENMLKEMKTFTNEQFADEKFMKAFNEKYDNIKLE